MPRIEEIDKRFSTATVVTGGEFISIDEPPFAVYGLAGKDDFGYYRIPQALADTVNFGVSFLCRHLAGVVVRFSTNAETLAIRAGTPRYCDIMPHMTALGSAGFDVYEGTRFICSYQPPIPVTDWEQEKGLFRLETDHPEGFHDYTVYLPLYGGYRDIFFKVNEGAELRPPMKPFVNDLPIVFYGSSITRGGCAGKPSMAFTNLLSRYNNLYVRNLGFSGSACAEEAMVDYLCRQEMCCFVMDYDHNSPADQLEERHLGFYQKIRAARPDLPILMASAIPIFNCRGFQCDRRRDIIRRTYEAAKAAGDDKVWFVNGWDFFRDVPFDDCTPDGCHPNDVGMYCMYRGFEAALKAVVPQYFGKK